ncbi:hypothetical protein A8B78_11765 [Jannaschia sp. EhC01]|nr:hypothetical protein A8B78_11765 [Jannaschia sp. EhC01]
MNRAKLIALSVALVMPAPSLSAQNVEDGAVLYSQFCAACHGMSLQGDGPMASALTVRSSDLTALSENGVFPVFDVVRQIDGRDPLLAHGGDMPIFGPWFAGDGADVAMAGPGGQLMLMSRPIADLVAFLMEEQR